GVGGCASATAREGEGLDPRPGRVGGRASADAVAGREEKLPVRRTQRQSDPARPVRGPPSAHPLPRFFEPGVKGWPEHACVGCSMLADQVAHLNTRDTTLAFASRASQKDIERVKAHMGWEMPWYTI